ncbi:hypothetical protein BYT27DRAFT_7229196 [Phlegmacium glaucopus]|nr:hypothetical protein BYT27DRAFT_7229196 [Phlegmacium glaucopus]
MSEAEEAIVANAAYHASLLTAISQFEYVPSAKKHQISYIKDIEGQLATIQGEVAQLAEKTKKERKEHETLRDSTGRRFAHKLLGKREKYEAMASKEEREYVEALEKEMVARGNEAVVQQLLDEGRNELINLTEKEQQLHSIKTELSALYGRVFDGPTESFPEDDRLEYDLHAAEKRHDQIQAGLNSESQAAEILARAVRYMDACQSNMQEALGYSRYDMWGGGSMADMMERNALTNAQTNASQVEMLVSQAIRASPRVQSVGRVNIARGSIISDVFFDNIYTDMAFHNKIKQSAAQVVLSNQRLKAERDAARRRVDAAGAQLVQASRALDRCRRELHEFRKATFESYLAQNPPPPSYDVVTTDVQPVPSDTTNKSSPPEEKTFPLTRSRPPDPVASDSSSSLSVPMPQAPEWGSRNPYAAAMAERTQAMSID